LLLLRFDMKKRMVLLWPCLLFLLLSCQSVREKPEPEKIRICSFNIQIFGVAKMSKPEVAAILADIVSRADLTAIQEVRSASPEPVEQFMALLPEKYAYVLGPREGRSSSKEQYWIIYDTAKLTVLGEAAWPDEGDIYERNPLGVYFQAKDKFDFILINNHLQPSAAGQEINALPGVIAWYQELWNETDVLAVGDFNADGAYYDESFLVETFPEPASRIIITNEYDTTVGESDNTYDRFIITSSAIEDYADSCGVLRFDEEFDFSQYGITPQEVSDHYPIWADFYIGMDTD
jgi:endonuclease/exonuclease/phosphatase family metal-dependent hydrolase